MADYVIRTAERQDIHSLSLLMQEYIVDFYKSPQPTDESILDLIQMLLRGEEGIQFVAKQNGRLVGFATLYFTYSTNKAHKIVIMNDLYVVEDMRSEGIGTGLFEACNLYRNTNDYASMVWETASSNERAQTFYMKMGATQEDWITYCLGAESIGHESKTHGTT
ncbi:GNAT family N-acetyltransferase [Paenibacillus yanchengensis]|uniref:GNAT family N-acetyltransferase n=1 Tax=Paenibacillus yanchengensis TaxID=2035833 RepID=A0ABW4YGR3_9BACL